jgi:pectate lyase
MKRLIVLFIAVLPSVCMANELYAQHGAGVGGSAHGLSARPTSPTKGLTGGQKTPSEMLQQNKNLSSKLSTILAKQNITNIQDAAQGFKNLGQFVAAVHVSQNLGIPFTQLKSDMMNGDSLGKAIHALKPDVNSQAESKKGLKQANEDIKGSESKSNS